VQVASPPRSAVREMPPRGHYLAFEVGRLAGVSGQTIGQWKHYGYVRASREAETYPNVYSYQDVAEAMVVHHLLDRQVPLGEIGRAIGLLHDRYGRDWPLTGPGLDLYVAGTHVAVREGEDLYDLSEHEFGWHLEMDVGELRRIAADLRRGGWAAREHPNLRYIEISPNRLSGRPAIRGTRVAAEDVARLASEAQGRSILKRDYGIVGPPVDDAITWWEAVQQYERLAA
jgi:uncharacterized protein (DUF433 family)/DNA-binding transcriptional MerR regulator